MKCQSKVCIVCAQITEGGEEACPGFIPAAASAGYGVKCPKCGSGNIKARHIAAGTLINSSSMAKVENEFIRSTEYDYFFKLTAKSEHLLKLCECSYWWWEKVAS